MEQADTQDYRLLCKRFLTVQGRKRLQKNQNYLDKTVPVSIGILGGGVGGLNTALQLDEIKELGYQVDYQIIEGDNRVGGRIKTINYIDGKDDNWQYSDMGAMRLPVAQVPTFDLIDYVNEKITKKNGCKKSPSNYAQLVYRDFFFDSRNVIGFDPR